MDSKYPRALVINYNVPVKASTILRLPERMLKYIYRPYQPLGPDGTQRPAHRYLVCLSPMLHQYL